MHGLLTIEEDAQAKALGWALELIYDLATQKWMVEVFPRVQAIKVIELARANHPVAVKTLKLVMAARNQGKK